MLQINKSALHVFCVGLAICLPAACATVHLQSAPELHRRSPTQEAAQVQGVPVIGTRLTHNSAKTPSAGTASSEAAKPPASAIQLTLLEAGEDPRRLLRYQLVAGEWQGVEVVYRVTTEFKPSHAPTRDRTHGPMAIIANSRVREIDADGNAVIEYVIHDINAAAPDQLSDYGTAMLDAQLKAAIGLRGEFTRTPEGTHETGRWFHPDPESNPSALKIFQKYGAPPLHAPLMFPKVPVGIGARWSVELDRVVVGKHYRSKLTYELISHSAKSAHLTIVQMPVAPDSPEPPSNALPFGEVDFGPWRVQVQVDVELQLDSGLTTGIVEAVFESEPDLTLDEHRQTAGVRQIHEITINSVSARLPLDGPVKSTAPAPAWPLRYRGPACKSRVQRLQTDLGTLPEPGPQYLWDSKHPLTRSVGAPALAEAEHHIRISGRKILFYEREITSPKQLDDLLQVTCRNADILQKPCPIPLALGFSPQARVAKIFRWLEPSRKIVNLTILTAPAAHPVGSKTRLPHVAPAKLRRTIRKLARASSPSSEQFAVAFVKAGGFQCLELSLFLAKNTIYDAPWQTSLRELSEALQQCDCIGVDMDGMQALLRSRHRMPFGGHPISDWGADLVHGLLITERTTAQELVKHLAQSDLVTKLEN